MLVEKMAGAFLLADKNSVEGFPFIHAPERERL